MPIPAENNPIVRKLHWYLGIAADFVRGAALDVEDLNEMDRAVIAQVQTLDGLFQVLGIIGQFHHEDEAVQDVVTSVLVLIFQITKGDMDHVQFYIFTAFVRASNLTGAENVVKQEMAAAQNDGANDKARFLQCIINACGWEVAVLPVV